MDVNFDYFHVHGKPQGQQQQTTTTKISTPATTTDQIIGAPILI